jgi:hypothetical protein
LIKDIDMSEIMKSVTIKDGDVLEILNEFKDLWYSDMERFKKNLILPTFPHSREHYISDDYKNKIINMGQAHNGYPEALLGYNLRDILKDTKETRRTVNDDILQYNKKFVELNERLQALLATRHNALCAIYPPGGFIAWHNNANASSYNIIITWSETGDGYWKHVDPHTKEEVLVKDVPGWQAKAFYFGSYQDHPNDLVYHVASTDCWRMTISYTFDLTHKEFWEDAIEELERG